MDAKPNVASGQVVLETCHLWACGCGSVIHETAATYGYGEMDEHVGPLTADEIAFLDAAGATVVSDPGGHVDAIFTLTGPALATALPSHVT